MQLLVSSQMEAGMEEVLDEMVDTPMIKMVGLQGGNNWLQRGNNWVQGGNIRQGSLQGGQGAPPGNGVCLVCTIRYVDDGT